MTATTTAAADLKFMKEVENLRHEYMIKRDSTNLVPPAGRPVIHFSRDVIDGILFYTYCYEDDTSPRQCIRLADIPGTLSGDILRLKQNIPEVDGDYEIIGDKLQPLKQAQVIQQEDSDDDSDDIEDVLALLPVVHVDPDKHITKKSRYESEIRNLLMSQGGSCPGVPKSNNIIQLLGRSSQGELVFEKFHSHHFILYSIHPPATYKRWILQIISGLKCLHSLGIIHRDLRINNLVFSADNSRVLIIDLESHWGNRQAPEVSRQPILDAGWSEKSDIYDLGNLIKGLVYGNFPIIECVEWYVPPPLDGIVEACTRTVPEERPSLDELYGMVERI